MQTNDPIELMVASALDDAKIDYIHESERNLWPQVKLDFWLPAFGCHIECKQFSTDRTAKQIEGLDVIVVQGKSAAEAFCRFVRGAPF